MPRKKGRPPTKVTVQVGQRVGVLIQGKATTDTASTYIHENGNVTDAGAVGHKSITIELDNGLEVQIYGVGHAFEAR